MAKKLTKHQAEVIKAMQNGDILIYDHINVQYQLRTVNEKGGTDVKKTLNYKTASILKAHGLTENTHGNSRNYWLCDEIKLTAKGKEY